MDELAAGIHLMTPKSTDRLGNEKLKETIEGIIELSVQPSLQTVIQIEGTRPHL